MSNVNVQISLQIVQLHLPPSQISCNPDARVALAPFTSPLVDPVELAGAMTPGCNGRNFKAMFLNSAGGWFSKYL